MNNQFKAQSLNRKSYWKFTLSYFSVTCFKHVGLLWPISAFDRKQVRGYIVYRLRLILPLSSGILSICRGNGMIPSALCQWRNSGAYELVHRANPPQHYDDVIMTMLASQITSLTVVYSIVYSGVNQRKHQSSASLAFVRTGEFPAQMASYAENVSI